MQFPLQRRRAGLSPLALSAAVSLLCNTLKRCFSPSVSPSATLLTPLCYTPLSVTQSFDFSGFSLLFLSVFIRPQLPLMLVPCPYYIMLPATFLSASSFLPCRCFFLPTYQHVPLKPLLQSPHRSSPVLLPSHLCLSV